jgi:hypothetical protein
MTRQRAIEIAARRARKFRQSYAVAMIDHEDTRRLTVLPYEDTQHDEFFAFAGEIEYVVHPDGNIEV